MIILIGHRKRVGKNTFGGYLRAALMAEKTGRTWELLSNVNLRSFAYEMKVQCHLAFSGLGLEHPDYYEKYSEKKDVPLPCGSTPRSIWIDYGEACKSIDPNIWARIGYSKHTGGISIFTDFRFPCEHAPALPRISDRIITVKIERPDLPPTDDPADCALDSFAAWDRIIVNREGKQQELYLEAVKLAKDLLR